MAEANAFKHTLNLPKTEMPMKAGLINIEPRVLEKWKTEKTYGQRLAANKNQSSFIFHDGPPYPNGNIHLGHALNKILKDIVVKYHLMKGHYAPFVPGWDCHGLPIETQLLKELKKNDVAPEEVHEFRDQCRDYALKYVDLQRSQFVQLGIFADFDHPYLTLDPVYEKSVISLFGKCAEQGLIYEGRKPIHWCMHCKTALAEAEIEYADETSPAVYVRFGLQEKVLGQAKVDLIVWTTTPWTLPANVAVAVNPVFTYVVFKAGDKRLVCVEELLETVTAKLELNKVDVIGKIKGQDLIGLSYKHPFINRISPVVGAPFVSDEDGSGMVHIAPGHGYDDYLVGLENDLPIIMPVDESGRFTEDVENYAGQEVFAANKHIVADMEANGALLITEKIKHSYPHCWRCNSAVIFRATKQWFIKMDGDSALRQNALANIQEVEWFPGWGEKRIRSMVEQRPDWCISRQRHWGIPIPVFHCASCEAVYFTGIFNQAVVDLVAKEGTNAWFTRSVEEILPKGLVCRECGGKEFLKDQNIMDVWLESGASHEAVLRTHRELSFPADLYLEGSDQHRGWFQSSLLTSVGSYKTAPYRQVLTHGFTIDEKGQKMSKSKGNVIDPLKVMKVHGGDILRLWASSTDFKNDVSLSENILRQVKDAFTKIRNTMRFLISNLNDFDVTKDAIDFDKLKLIDQWILAKLNHLVSQVDDAYNNYEFHHVYHHVYNFSVIELSSLYLDIQKDNLYCNSIDNQGRRSCQTAMSIVVRKLIIMLAPILSFSMEDVYSYLSGERMDSVFLETFPEGVSTQQDEKMISEVTGLLNVRDQVNVELEKARQDKQIGSSLEAFVEVTTPDPAQLTELPSFLIVSQLVIKKGKSFSVTVTRAAGEKCQRCWKFDELSEDGLCPRCFQVVHSD